MFVERAPQGATPLQPNRVSSAKSGHTRMLRAKRLARIAPRSLTWPARPSREAPLRQTVTAKLDLLLLKARQASWQEEPQLLVHSTVLALKHNSAKLGDARNLLALFSCAAAIAQA
jgi:hypothetical protein